MFEQAGFRCKLEWGRRGAREAAARGDILVIVDTLSFSSAVVTAIQHGAIIYPCAEDEDLAALAKNVEAEIAVKRRDYPAKGRFSLSPLSFLNIKSGTKVIMASPNGATCSRYGQEAPYLMVGALLNASAVAKAVTKLLDRTELSVTIIASGERWSTPSEDGNLRFALEDYLGAGAILTDLPYSKSPEAQVCEAAFQGSRGKVLEILEDCGSGRELNELGYVEDVHHAARLNLYQAVPLMQDNCLVRMRDED